MKVCFIGCGSAALGFSGSPTQLKKEARSWRVRCKRLFGGALDGKKSNRLRVLKHEIGPIRFWFLRRPRLKLIRRRRNFRLSFYTSSLDGLGNSACNQKRSGQLTSLGNRQNVSTMNLRMMQALKIEIEDAVLIAVLGCYGDQVGARFESGVI